MNVTCPCVLENGQLIKPDSVESLPTPLTFILAVNSDPALGNRDGQGLSRFVKLQTILEAWAAALPANSEDKLGLVWNGGAVGSYYTMAPDRKRALVHMLFYADSGPDDTGVRVAGNFRAARLWTLEGKESGLEIIPQKDAVELHLPAVAQYAAVELEA